MAAETKTAAMLGQRAAIDQLGAPFGQGTFAKGGKFFIEHSREDQLEDGVTQKLQALVSLHGRPFFVRHGRMRERQAKQIWIAEGVAEIGLERAVVGHGWKAQESDFKLQEGPKVKAVHWWQPLVRGKVGQFPRELLTLPEQEG